MGRYGRDPGIAIYFVLLCIPVVATIESPFTFQSKFVFEKGTSNIICCSYEFQVIEMKLFHMDRLVSMNSNQTSICYEIETVTSKDAGNYTCFVFNTRHELDSEKSFIEVYERQPILDQTITYPLNQPHRTLTCNSKNIDHAHERWEHRSFFGEHIRYLNTTGSDEKGAVTLPYTSTESERYKDDGIYRCAGNVLMSRRRRLREYRAVIVVSSGPPIFLASNSRVQYGQIGKTGTMQFRIYSTSKISCSFAESEKKPTFNGPKHEIQIRSANFTDMFHRMEVTVSGFEVLMKFRELIEEDFQQYKVTVCNKFGNSSFGVHLRSIFQDHSLSTSVKKSTMVIISSCIGAGLGLLTVFGLVICILNWKRLSQHDEIEDIENGQVDPIENVMYQEAGDIGLLNHDPVQNGSLQIGNLSYAELVFPLVNQNIIASTSTAQDRTEYAEIMI